MYSGTSLLQSPTGLGKNDLNSEVTILPKLPSYFFNKGAHLGPSEGDLSVEVTVNRDFTVHISHNQ